VKYFEVYLTVCEPPVLFFLCWIEKRSCDSHFFFWLKMMMLVKIQGWIMKISKQNTIWGFGFFSHT